MPVALPKKGFGPTCRARPSRLKGFTLVEVLFATSVLGVTFGALLVAFTTMNLRANQSRFQTCAQTLAQNILDRALSDEFMPQINVAAPAVTLGTRYWDPDDQDGDSTPYSPNPVLTAVYVNPETGQVLISGQVKIQVADAGLTRDGDDLHTRRVTVTVTYTHKGQQHQVTLTTLRTTDL